MSSEYLNNKRFEKTIVQFQTTKRQLGRLHLILEDLRVTALLKKERGNCNKHERVQGKVLVEEIINMQNEYEDSHNQLALDFQILAENLLRFRRFSLLDEEDAIQEGIIICLDKVEKFDANKGKAFAYMTQCIKNHFKQLYRSAKSYNDLKKKYFNHLQSINDRVIIKNSEEVAWISNNNDYSN